MLSQRIFYSLAIILFWYPVYESLHQGQITILVTALYVAGMKRSEFKRGVLIGFITAVKPVYGLVLPFAGYLFGWWCVFGMVVGLLPAVVAWSWFIEYVLLFPTISQHDYLMPSIAGLIGVVPSTVVTCIACGLIVWKVHEKEWAYLLVIGSVSIGTALWVHSYTPVILPVLFGLNRYWNKSE